MQPIATWLVARPQNGVIGLALTFFFPLGPVLSSLVMAHLVYANGVRVPAIQGLVATALLSTLAIVLQTSVFQVVASAAIWWLPVFVFAAMAGYWRSVPLALQVSVMIAMMATVGYFIVLGDPSEYWNEAIVMTIELARQAGLHAQADMLSQSQQLIVPQMTMLFVFTVWSFYVAITLAGYVLFQTLPDKGRIYGRFCDLNFGRVIAVIMAGSSVGAVLTGWAWLQNLGFVAFAVFWLQGLAILHWLRSEKHMPVLVLIATYAALPFLMVLLVIPLAVLGYMDAWFDFRARARLKNNKA